DVGKLPSASATSGRKSHLSRGASLDEVSGDTAWSSSAQQHLSPQPSGLKQSGQNWDSSCNGEWKQGQCELRLVGGLDISFVPDPGSNPGQDVQQVPGSDPGPAVPKAAIAQGRPNRRPGWAVAALVVLSFPELDVVCWMRSRGASPATHQASWASGRCQSTSSCWPIVQKWLRDVSCPRPVTLHHTPFEKRVEEELAVEGLVVAQASGLPSGR
ncbi:hypothetical protein HaLaN_27223, partial [Haematococcus lacustris]